jgi:hypothetical protein
MKKKPIVISTNHTKGGKEMKKILILTAVFLLFCSYNSFAGMNCATKYHKIRARVFKQDITHEQKAQVYGRLFDAERLCNEGKTKSEKKALKDAAGLVDLDEVFKDTGEKN